MINKVFTYSIIATLISLVASSLLLLSNSSAVSVSGTDSAPVSVSVSNSPLAYYISVSSSHGSSGSPVNLSYTMDGSGNQLGNVVSSSDLVTIDTNSPMSHQLLLSTIGTSDKLLSNESDEEVINTYIAPSSSNSLSTAAALGSNTWGFALSNSTPGIVTNNFNTEAEYTSTDQTIQNTNKYTSVPVKNNEVLVLEDTTATSTTTIYYGVLADRSLPAGDYSNTILYTALAEQPSDIRVLPSSGEVGNTITIYTSINTTGITSETATVEFYTGTNANPTIVGTCTNPAVHLDGDNFLYITCTVPRLRGSNNFGIKVTLTNLSTTLSADNIFTNTYNPQTIADITYMQEMTPDICKNSTTKQKAQLLDSRGQGNGGSDKTSTYGIVKALGDEGDEDSECWMTDNLNLYNVTISAEESDFDSPETYTIPDGVTATSQWASNIYNAKRVEVAHGLGKNANTKEGDGIWGTVYYNWTVAVAKETTTGVTTAPGTSVCPKGWLLPLNGGTSTSKTFAHLFAKIADKPITTGPQVLSNPYLNLTRYYGMWYYVNASEYLQSSNGHFWSGTPYSGDEAYSMKYYSTSIIASQNSSKGYGKVIRCVAK